MIPPYRYAVDFFDVDDVAIDHETEEEVAMDTTDCRNPIATDTAKDVETEQRRSNEPKTETINIDNGDLNECCLTLPIIQYQI